MFNRAGQSSKAGTACMASRGLAQIMSLSLAVMVPVTLGLSSQPMLAQTDEGHTDGGGGEGGANGNANGNGGVKGRHGRHHQVVDPVSAPLAVDGAAAGGGAGAGRKLAGTYMRAEMGIMRASPGNSSWLPPGYPDDPQVFFDLGSSNGGFAGVALGYDWANGARGEVELLGFGKTDFAGPWSYTVPATPGPHASVQGSVRSVAVMGNLFYEPFQNPKSKFAPYVMVGLGLANNTMSDWTRINTDSGRDERSFAGASHTDLAMAVGFGVSMEVGKTGKGDPMTLEMGYRYFDLGTAQGSTTPLPGSGAGGDPVGALKLDQSNQVVTLGLRIPLRGN